MHCFLAGRNNVVARPPAFMPSISAHAEHGAGCTHGRQEMTADWNGPACSEITRAFAGEINREIAGWRGIPRLAICLSAAVLGVLFLLVSQVASPAAAPAAPAASNAPGPLAWWRFNEGAGSVVHDVTGHGYDGVIHGAATMGRGAFRKGAAVRREFVCRGGVRPNQAARGTHYDSGIDLSCR